MLRGVSVFGGWDMDYEDVFPWPMMKQWMARNGYDPEKALVVPMAATVPAFTFPCCGQRVRLQADRELVAPDTTIRFFVGAYRCDVCQGEFACWKAAASLC